MINTTFFSLIRLSIGTSSCLIKHPSSEDWCELYRMAVKQSLIGVCFAGLRNYLGILQQKDERADIPQKLYHQWLATTVQIQQRNELLNRRCVELQLQLNSIGLRNSVLKGQGVASLYKVPNIVEGDIIDLALYRQSGDIDVWCQGISIDNIVAYLKDQGYAFHATAAHVETELFSGIPVEFHAYPSFLKSPWKNRILQNWINSFDVENFDDSLGFTTPPFEFNVIFLLVHMYHHVLFEGLGLRQLMDYYFLLQSNCKEDIQFAYREQLGKLGLNKFAGAVMWVLKEVFNLENAKMICLPDERFGRLLLDEILQGGNFGKYASKQKGLRERNTLVRTYNYTKRRFRFFAIAPEEVVCAPFWSLWHYIYRKRRGYYQD